MRGARWRGPRARNAPGHADRLRVLRRDSASGTGAPLDLGAGEIELVDFGRGRLLQKGVRFPVTRFGTYVVAIEEDR